MLWFCCNSPLLLLSSLERERVCQAWSLAPPASNPSMWEAQSSSACGPTQRTISLQAEGYPNVQLVASEQMCNKSFSELSAARPFFS